MGEAWAWGVGGGVAPWAPSSCTSQGRRWQHQLSHHLSSVRLSPGFLLVSANVGAVDQTLPGGTREGMPQPHSVTSPHFLPELHNGNSGRGPCKRVSLRRRLQQGGQLLIETRGPKPRFPDRSQPATLGPGRTVASPVRQTDPSLKSSLHPLWFNRGSPWGRGASSFSPQAAGGRKLPQ